MIIPRYEGQPSGQPSAAGAQRKAEGEGSVPQATAPRTSAHSSVMNGEGQGSGRSMREWESTLHARADPPGIEPTDPRACAF
jgi:hypothetical protein